MVYTATNTVTETYSIVDIEIVMRRFAADILMIAASSTAITEAKARDYGLDVETLAKAGYLNAVDLTLFSGGVEVQASRYAVEMYSGDLIMSRPGGVLWPRVADANFRIVLYYTDTYTDTVRERMRGLLKIAWVPTNADTSHSGLTQTGGRDYASKGWGLRRKDYGT